MKRTTDLQDWQIANGIKRHQHNVRRDRIKKARRRSVATRSITKVLFGRRSKINKHLAHTADESLPIDRKGQILVSVPKTLSIIEAPEGAIKLVARFAKAAMSPRRIRSIFFDHSKLENYDLAANALLDVVASELDSQYTVRGSRLSLRCKGALPTNPRVRRFIRAIGIIKHLDVKHEAPSKKESTSIEVFDVRLKHYSPAAKKISAGRRDKVAKKFVDHIRKCLAKINRELTPSGVTRLTEYLTEILNNAEDHAGLIDWTLQGYLDGSAATAFCEIAIFNFGSSIADTLRALPRDCYTWKQIAPYIDMHEGHQFFGPDWREEDLLTVMALQPHVSSKNHSENDTRGQGTVDLIQFFQTVFEECAEAKSDASMAILSGSTHINFDGTHKIQGGAAGARPVIAFNKNNDLRERPDKKYVRPLGSSKFPGTIISIRFPLSSDSLTEETQDA